MVDKKQIVQLVDLVDKIISESWSDKDNKKREKLFEVRGLLWKMYKDINKKIK